MRLLAIGDIHGCLRALNTLLDAVSPTPDDQIITLGDYVDRGPDSRGVLDRLLALHASGQLVALRGNHDLMMLDARTGRDPGWLAVGGKQTLSSYGIAEWKIDQLTEGQGWFDDPDELLANIPEQHWRFLEDHCLAYYETVHHIFVHANLYPDLPLDEQPDYMLYWEKLVEPCAHVSGKIMICGHTRQRTGRPLDLGSTICLDTGAYEDGWLTCLDVNTGSIWQANELGKARTGWLDDCPTDE
jgi:serine/threonine protein phosphatase 1